MLSNEQCFPNFNMHTNHLGSWQNAGASSAGLGWGLGVFISHKLPGDTGAAGAAGPKPTLGGAGNRRYMLLLIALLGLRSRQVWLITVTYSIQILLIIK